MIPQSELDASIMTRRANVHKICCNVSKAKWEIQEQASTVTDLRRRMETSEIREAKLKTDEAKLRVSEKHVHLILLEVHSP